MQQPGGCMTMGRVKHINCADHPRPGGRVIRRIDQDQAAGGAAIAVNNKVQPGNNPAPKPEDN